MISFGRLILIVSLISGTTYAQTRLETKLIYEDYFAKLDKAFWKKSFHTFDNNLAQFSGKNIKVNDGRLILSITPTSLKGKRFSGAEIRSKESFRYGRFVARLKPANGEGVVSAFFLYDTRGKTHEEIDIEFTGKNTNLIHFNKWVKETESPFSSHLNFDASNTYHEYSILWTPDYICWEIDGKEVYKTSKDIPRRRMKLMFNIWASKSNEWAGKLNPAVLPASMEIDYIKIYSLY